MNGVKIRVPVVVIFENTPLAIAFFPDCSRSWFRLILELVFSILSRTEYELVRVVS